MLFFIDESWQSTDNGRYKVGVLCAIPINDQDFNDYSRQIFGIKVKHLSPQGAKRELKGSAIFNRFKFKLEQDNIESTELNLAREIFSHAKNQNIKVFASVTFAKDEIDLACANENQIERPFYYLFERIDLFMKENYPTLIAKLIFDDRGTQTNQRISKSLSNFFHKCSIGRGFDTILKVPFFAISNENSGIQLADMIGHIIGRYHTGNKNTIKEFYDLIKQMEFVSNAKFKINPSTSLPRTGIKVIHEKKKGAGEVTASDEDR